MESNRNRSTLELLNEESQHRLPPAAGARTTVKRLVPPPYIVDSPLSDLSSEDSNDVLMEVEVRTSGPDSALISSKIAVQEEEEKDRRLREHDCDAPTTGLLEKDSMVDLKDSGKHVLAFPRAESSHSAVGEVNEDLSVGVGKALTETLDDIMYKTDDELNIPEKDLADVFCFNNESRVNTARNSKSVENLSDFRQPPFTEKFNPFIKGEEHDILQCYSPTKSPDNKLDNLTLSKLLEVAFTERDENSESMATTNLESQSNCQSGCARSEFNLGDFPRLKEMLSKSPVSEATMHFTKVMSMENSVNQNLNYSNVSYATSSVNDACMPYGENNNNGIFIDHGFPSMEKRAQISISEDLKDQYQTELSNSIVNQNDHATKQLTGDEKSVDSSSPVRKGQSGIPRSKTPQRIPPPAPLLPPCRVCGEKASGFHYGVNTCEACKGFFRRSLCRKEPYVCVSNGSCQVQSGRRTVCSHCRLKRCLEVGMSKNAIKTGRYTHELRSKNIMEVKNLQQQRKRGITPTCTETAALPKVKVLKVEVECKPEINEELQEILETLMMAQTYLFEFLDDYYEADLILKRQLDVYKQSDLTLTDQLRNGIIGHTLKLNRYKQEKFDRMRNRANNLALVDGHGEIESSNSMSRDLNSASDVTISDAPSEHVKEQVMQTIIEDMERGIQGMVMFAKTVPGFVNLDLDDQSSLLKCSRFDIWYIGHIRCLNSDLQVGACEWYFHAEELSQVWGKKVTDMAFRLTDYGQKLNLTREETAALRAVSLTFPDRCVLNCRLAVDEIHSKMLDCFRYVASKRHPNFNKWLPDVINFLVYLREFGIEFDKKSSKMNLEWPLIQKNPLLLEVFFS